MQEPALHRFERDGKRFAIDPDTCFCFECDDVSWAVLEHYPRETLSRITHLLDGKFPAQEVSEVVGELEWIRSCKSILPAVTQESLKRQFEVERGLRELSVSWPAESGPARISSAAALLLGRSGVQSDLRLEVDFKGSVAAPGAVAEACRQAFDLAVRAGKRLSVVLRVEEPAWNKVPAPIADHRLCAEGRLSGAEGISGVVSAFAEALKGGASKLAKWAEANHETAAVRMVLFPRHAAFAEAVRALRHAGFVHIGLDTASLFVADPAIAPEAVREGLTETARFYAKELLAHRYFRLDPLAELFHRIYQGEARPRHDPAGLNALSVNAEGEVFPARLLQGQKAFRAGALSGGVWDEDVLAPFEDIGSVTTPACMPCWARSLCGGGTAAVHHALTGSIRTPREDWCKAQRTWMESAVAAFSLLSAEGVNFSRMYQSLTPSAKPSLRTLVRAAFRMHIGLRPIEEADAEWLVAWANWNEAAYFTSHESGLLIATEYDREMDSLHPAGFETELVLVRKNGAPFGLLKIRPESHPGVARVWLYFRNSADYTASAIRSSFRFILREAAKGQHVRRLLCPVGPGEDALADFLCAAGFQAAGIQREALFLHGAYHDMRIFAATIE